ncbi:hypothetical protein [Glutamicibacter endophyticus]|uniref:hypothetical protein n=1 Tax=Glutamicibacter endophyticus TaxID=1522174 RepID=UPI003AF1A9BF
MSLVVALGPWWLTQGTAEQFQSWPHAVSAPLALLGTMGMALLLVAVLARTVGDGVLRFTVVVDVVFCLGVLALTFGALLGASSKALASPLPVLSVVQLWTVGVCLLLGQLALWSIARGTMISLVLAVAVLGFAPSYWAAAMGTVLHAPVKVQGYLELAGPLCLGIALGVLGFLHVANLAIWAVALLIQWLMPGVLGATLWVLRGATEHQDVGIAQLWKTGAQLVRDQEPLWPAVTTLAVAMLLSVMLLIVGKVKARR